MELGKRIELKLPTRASSAKEGWDRFQIRARYLQIDIFCEDKLFWTQRFEPPQWKTVTVPKAPCPTPIKSVKIRASIWGSEKSGNPMLQGVSEIDEDRSREEEPLVIRLNFQISPEDW